MQSFGSLLRRLRGRTSVKNLAERIGVPDSYVVNIEAGRKIPTEKQARRLLTQGFGLTKEEVDRCILHVLLFDYGLGDEELRDLVINVIEQVAVPGGRERLEQFYQDHLDGHGLTTHG